MRKELKSITRFSRSIYLIFACLAFSLGVYNLYKFATRPVDECVWEDTEYGVRVISVEKGGSADRAGMLSGDILLRIAGENAVSSRRAQNILDEQKVGSYVGYLVLRQNELLQLQVKIVGGSFHPLALTMCCIGFLFLFVGLWIGWMRPYDVKVRVLFILFISFMLFWTLNFIPPMSAGMRRTMLVLRIFSFTTIPIFFLYFFLLYPNEHPFLKKSNWGKIVILSPSFLILIWLVLVFVFHYDFPLLPVGIGLWGLYFTLGLNRLGKSYKNEKNAQLRQQMRVLYWGITIGTVPPFLLILPGELGLNFPYGIYSAPLMGLIPLVFAYAIVRHRMMDIEILVKKSFVYTLLTGFIVGFYFAVVQLIGRFLQDVSGLTGTVVLLVSTLLVAVAFAPARERIQRVVDRAFYREAYDYRETLRQFARALNTLIEPDVLIRDVLQKICDTMHIQCGYFFTVDDDSCDCTNIQSYPESASQEIILLSTDSLFCQKLIEQSRPTYLSEWTDGNTEIKLLQEDLKGVVAVPLVHQDKFLGFIILGEKNSGIPFSTEDIELLATVGDQIAVAYENGRLHRALTEQERLKQELEIARQIQMNSLPQKEPSLPGYDIYGFSMPATEVGGDYYDYLYLPDGRLGIIIGDVSGKGTSAALYMSKIQGFFRALCSTIASPKELLLKVNKLSYEDVEEKSFMTLIAACLHPEEKTITVARAGHLPILFFESKKNVCHRWTPDGMGIALDEGEIFGKALIEERKSLKSGDALLFYSDGLTEAMNKAGEEFGEKRLENVFLEKCHLSSKMMGRAIIDTVNRFTEANPQSDDMTLIIIKLE